MIRIPVSILALAIVAGLCGACHSGGTDTKEQTAPATTPAPQASAAIVQPGAPGQASTVVAKVPAFNDNNYTDADVKFMQGMIHHHNQALTMVTMIPTHTDTVQVRELGQKIQISQSGEIQAMKDWLTDRHQEVPMIMADGSAMMGKMDMAAMPGMLTPEQMKNLDAARGHQFDQLFLTGMIQHHKGALSMVADLRAAGGGQEPNIADFTNRVDTDQRMEIVRMYGLLGEACRTTMNTRSIFRMILGAAAVSAVAATVFTAQVPAPAAAPGQRGGTPGQIAIPQPCTPELIAAEEAAAQQAAAGGRGARPTPCHKPDPRENLKPGLYDAGQAAKGMRLATTLHQPEGMFDPNPSPNGRSLDYANSDLAFSATNKLAIQGNFHGLILYDVSEPSEAKLKTIIVCPGGQGDVSVWGNLAFMSVESPGRTDCSTPPANGGGRGAAAAPAAAGAAAAAPRGGGGGRGAAPPDPNRMFGVRIFDISNPSRPVQVADVQTCRGSHTHSIAVDPKDKENIYIYVSGTAGIRSPEEKAGCVADPKAPNTSSYGIDVIKVPIAHPEKAAVVSHAYLFADANTGQIASLYGRQQGTGEPSANPTAGCHDVTSYPFFGLMGGACSGNGLLLDIHDVAHPKRLDDVADAAFSFWHSATFNNDATKLLFSDEWGGGTQPMCQSFDPPMWGGDAIYNIQGSGDARHLHFEGYYKMPAWNTATENCVAHNGGLVPVPGRDIMSQAFYQGGATVFDFTDAAHVKEIAYFDRGPIDANKLVIGGYWSVYYNNGYLYGSEIARGLDVFELTPTADLSQNEIDAAALATREGCGAPTDFNVQCQPHYVWPASFVVARAYLDQLTRDKALPQQKADAINAAIKQVETSTGPARKTAETQLNTLAAELTKDATGAPAIQAKRMRECASTIQKRDAELK